MGGQFSARPAENQRRVDVGLPCRGQDVAADPLVPVPFVDEHHDLAAIGSQPGHPDSHGATAHDPTGQPFEPERHQALLHEEVPGFADGTVVETFRKGYYFKDRLLRPALVKVAKGPEAQETTEPDGVH